MSSSNLFSKIRYYIEIGRKMQQHLTKLPDDWPKFQEKFNREVDILFSDIMNFEKSVLSRGDIDTFFKVKNFFIKNFRNQFRQGEYCIWSIDKPYGYAGDFKIMEDIYRNAPSTTGFGRLFDNYFQSSAISVAVRNRKEDIKKFIFDFVKKKEGKHVGVVSLACGPCRELRELLATDRNFFKNVSFDCVDNDSRAIEFSKKLLEKNNNIRFFKRNALRIALSKNISKKISQRYDVIYSAGLFDYLNKKISMKLIEALKSLLVAGGKIIIANVTDKYSNPSVCFMEWAGDWNLIYRSDNELKDIFIKSGFNKDDIYMKSEHQGIVNYIIASNSE